MDYKTVAEAKDMPGLRVVLSVGVPAPWSEAVKGICHVKRLPFIPVGQRVGEDNEDLVAWTGIRNAPTVVFNGERPLDRWLDILMLAERLQPEPRLLPTNPEDRIQVVGLAHEICGEWGFGWCRRAMLIGGNRPQKEFGQGAAERMRRDYSISEKSADSSQARVADILTAIAKRLREQRSLDSPYLIGRELTAVDIYWACFATLIGPLPNDLCPMPESARRMFSEAPPIVTDAKDPILFEHRNFIYNEHLKLPVDF
jgi:glutathione S-transferase